MKFYLFFLCPIFMFGLCSTSSKFSLNETVIRTNDSLERELLMLKNQAFCDCYYQATKNADSQIAPPDGSNYTQISELTIKYGKDENLKKIVEKWNRKEYLSYSRKNKLYLMRCLDFYNSGDLRLFIDSVRKVELKLLR